MINTVDVALTTENIFRTGTGFVNRVFVDAYFDYNIADLSFTDCVFLGVCYIKNVGGTITWNGLNKGGFIICNKPIPETLTGVGDVPEGNF